MAIKLEFCYLKHLDEFHGKVKFNIYSVAAVEFLICQQNLEHIYSSSFNYENYVIVVLA